MPNIKPVSDLRNYNEVLKDISADSPVFLTKNGRGKFVILDIKEYERTQAMLKLMSELSAGRKAGEEKGWFTLKQANEQLGILHD